MKDINKNNLVDLNDKKMGSLLVKFAIPTTIGIIFVTSYNIIDTIFVGRNVGSLGIAALGIVCPLWQFITALALLIGMGSASIISRSLSGKENEKAQIVMGNSIVLVITLGIVSTALVQTYLDPLLRFLGATENIMPYARDYLIIASFGYIFFLLVTSSIYLIRSEGNVKTAMLVMIIASVLNIILDPIFIITLDLGIKGAAYATIISQFSAFIYVVYYYVVNKSSLYVRLRHFKFNFPIIKEIFNLGFSSFIRVTSFSALTIIINNSLKIYSGELSIALYAITNRIFQFSTMPISGIIAGIQPIIAFNYGAKNFDRVKQSFKLSIVILTIIGALFFLAIMIFPSQIIGIFSKDTDLIQKGIFPIRMIILFLPLIGFQNIGTFFFQSIGKAVPSILLSMSRQILFLIPLILILPIFFNITGIWIAFPVADFLAIIMTAFFIKKELNNINLMKYFPIDLKVCPCCKTCHWNYSKLQACPNCCLLLHPL